MVNKKVGKAVKKVTRKSLGALMKPNKEGLLFAAIADIEIEKGFNARTKVVVGEELVESIRARGVTNPIHVRWKNRKKEVLLLVDGARRLEAAKQADLGSVPVISNGSMSDEDATIAMLTSNVDQQGLNKKDRLGGFKRLRRFGLQAEEIAKIMGVDRRTVSEALRVDGEASSEMKTAALKPAREGGISTRVAARASSLPKKEQKRIVKQVAGKSTQAGLQEVRKTEIKLGRTHPGKKSRQEEVITIGYTLAPDVVERCQALEEAVRRRYKDAQTKVLTAQIRVIECLKGNLKVSDVFDWDKV